ncbi:hypothetical protein F4604DRAFT_1800557 [Suillus subluteus]|nr:hypothetical protein F4604DRAFT_1800557 [Suillus subluteus]
MVGRPKSVTRKKQLAKQEQEIAITRAINEYRTEQRKDEPAKSLRAICREVQQKYRAETGKPVVVDHMTVSQERAWLKPEEAEKVVEYCLELGRRGFPIGHRRLKEHFPAGGVGKNWTDRVTVR